MSTTGNTAGNVTTGKPNPSGAVYVAPKGTTLPTDASTVLSGSYVCLGYVSEDGLKNANEINVSNIKAWGGLIVYSSLDEFTDAFSLALLETLNVDVLKTVYGDSNVSVDGNGKVHVSVKSEMPAEKVWVFDLALRDGWKKRVIISDGIITAREEISYTDSDAVAYGITITAFPDASGSTHEEYAEPGEEPSH